MRLFLFCLLISGATFGNIQYNTLTTIGAKYLRYTETKELPSYSTVIQNIKNDRRKMKSENISIDSCRGYILDKFENEVFPHWVGTTWDYNGYTNVPGKGKLIACGYFVSTPLKHMGFNWNRYELAKMYSKDIVETVCADTSFYSDKSKMIQEIKSKPDNLYIVGLDSHVGMILKTEDRVWFVHSNYYDIKGPDKEIASMSQALADSENYWVGTFLDDRNVKRWLSAELIPTPRKKS